MTRLRVRGLRKVKAVAVLFALAHNLLRAATLAPELVGLGRHSYVRGTANAWLGG